jgi:hypothetical protein
VKPGPQVVVAVGVGYLLGRTRKMRLALMIAAAGATGKLGVGPRQLLQQGFKQLAASPELGKITETVRGDLLDAAKSAAITAASGRIESLNSRLQDQVSAPTKRRRSKEAEEPDDEGDEGYAEADEVDEYDDEDDLEDESDEEPKASGRRSRQSSTRQARGASTRSPVRRARR